MLGKNNMFTRQPLQEEYCSVQRTSRLWFLGFGMKIKFLYGVMSLRKGWKMVTISYNDVRGVHTERRFFRGHTLVVNTHTKPVRFRMTKRQAIQAMHFIQAQVANRADLK